MRSLVITAVAASAVALRPTPDAGRPMSAPAAPPTGTVVAANMQDNTASVVDVASGKVLATLPTGAGPHEVAASHDGRWAVVSNYGVRGAAGNSLTVIDLAAATPVVARTITLGEFQRPHGSAFLPGDSIFVVTSEMKQAIVLVDFRNGTVIGSIPTTQRGSHMVMITADGRRAFTSNVPDSTISELDITGRKFVRTIHVAPMVEGIAVAPNGETVWVGSNQARTVSVVHPGASAMIDTIGGFGLPYRMAITPDGKTAIVADPPNSRLRIFDATTRRELGEVPIAAPMVATTAEFKGSASPEGLSVSRDGKTVYVALQGANAVAVVDLASRAVVSTIPVGTGPDGLAYSPMTHR